MKKTIIAAVCATGCAVSLPLSAQEKADQSIFDFGGDVRARYEFKDNWPEKGKTSVSPAYEDYLRFRTRVWGEAKQDEFKAYIRLANEFRNYRNTSNNDKQEFPDELVLDNLYLQWDGDKYGLKVGRQDIKMGSERIISDGTPGDGSRTTFFDAAILTYKFGQEAKSKVDFFGTWNHYRNELEIGDTEANIYDMTKIRSGSPYSKMDETGAGAYVTVKESKEMPFDVYWVWKMEEDFYDKANKLPGRDFHTLGLRLMPKFNDWLSGELESAYQFGRVDSLGDYQSRDISAAMVYAGLTGKPKDVAWSPSLTAAILYMSGDKDSYYKTTDGSTDNGWNPVFNRTAWFSEIGSGMYDQARWSNMVFPHAELAVTPVKDHQVSLTVGPMYAAEKDAGATDDYKGLFAKAKYGFPLPELAGIKLGGSVSGEILDFGDYYETDEDYASWIRFEVTAKF